MTLLNRLTLLSVCFLLPFIISSAAVGGELAPGDIQGVENAFGREELGGYDGEPPEVRFFYEANERPPRYEGEVAVLLDEPDKPYIALGRVWLLRETTRDILLGHMKEVAARYGANAIILYTADPIERSRNRLLWKSRAVLIQ
jgi:hypothetical protein